MLNWPKVCFDTQVGHANIGQSSNLLAMASSLIAIASNLLRRSDMPRHRDPSLQALPLHGDLKTSLQSSSRNMRSSLAAIEFGISERFLRGTNEGILWLYVPVHDALPG